MNNQAMSADIARQTAEFLARGGQVEVLPAPWERPPQKAEEETGDWVDTHHASRILEKTTGYMHVLARLIRNGEDIGLRFEKRKGERGLFWYRPDLLKKKAELGDGSLITASNTNNKDQ